MTAANQNFLDEHAPASVDDVIDRYKKNLVKTESARLPTGRSALLTMYDRLQQRKIRREQRKFYASASEDEIADGILKLAEAEIAEDGVKK
ncbi:MAG: hypothetical protein KGI37_06430 [Alphaproteobacteria bacterium]|nr:hypothetical protein [Alphaproteobacteria bacterium]